MSNSWSNASNSAIGGARRIDVPQCECLVDAVVRLSKTPENPGRRFYGCALFVSFITPTM